MILQEIRIIVEPAIGEDFYRLWITVIPEVYENRLSIKKIYPIDHIKSLFDTLWEDIGRELKDRLLEQDKDV